MANPTDPPMPPGAPAFRLAGPPAVKRILRVMLVLGALFTLLIVHAIGGSNPFTPPGHEGYVFQQPLAIGQRYGTGSIDIDVLEACLVTGIKIYDPTDHFSVTFSGWLAANVDHPIRNQDDVESQNEERFRAEVSLRMNESLT